MTAPAPGARKAALVFIFVTVLIDILAFGLIIPVLPHLVEEFVGGSTRAAAHWVGIFGTAFALIQFFTAPVQGALSDRYGRRPVILLSCLGLGLDFVFMALANSLPWLFLGRVISGITSASFTTANAYIADITAPEKRAQAFGLIGAAFGVGFTLAPAIGGWLGEIDLRLPFWGAALLALCNFVYGWFVLPESLPAERRAAKFDWSRAHPLGSLRLLRSYPQVFGLAAVLLLINLAHYVFPSVLVLFAEYRYQWGPGTIGQVLAVVGIFSVVVNMLLVKRAVARFGERRALLIGLSTGAAGFAIYGFAPTGTWFLAGIPVMALWAFATPATQALITRRIGVGEHGRVQGALSSLVSLAGVVGPALYAEVFAWFIGPRAPVHQPGAAFLVAGGLLLVALALAWQHARAPRAVPVADPA